MRLPYWHTKLDECSQDSKLVTSCHVLDKPDPRLPAPGFVPCQPEALRGRAEKERGQKVSLDAYSLARLIRSEFPHSSIETKAAAIECVINRARLLKISPTDLLLKNEHNVGLYGRITQGRGFDTSLDPTVGDLCVADFVLAGKSENLARHGDSYAHPAWSRDLSPWLSQGVWVGHLPNVPLPWLIIFRQVSSMTPAYQAINKQAILALKAPQNLLGEPTDTEPHPHWDLVKAVGIAAGTGLVLFGVGVAFTDLYGRRWKSWNG